jgi:serine/threonine protein kinase
MKPKRSDSLSRWAPDCERLYKHVSLLRCGAFTSVWVAKPKQKNPCLYHSRREKCTCCCVAVKSTLITERGDSDIALKFAKREVQILLELDHPHIIKVVREFPYLDSPVFSVALTLASGPTIEELVEYRGALGIPFVQNVTKQLISALAYMHSCAVIHRDVEPDNVIIIGASLSDDANWCDSYDDPQVQKLLPQWKAMLLDFSYAKALSPEIILEKDTAASDSSLLYKMNSIRSRFAVKMSLDEKLYCGPEAVAEGNGCYLAPEVVKELDRRGANFSGQDALNCGTAEDAYSLGAVLRYMLTGVPPQYSIRQYMSLAYLVLSYFAHLLLLLISILPFCSRRVRKRYKNDVDVPEEASNLVFFLTIKNTKNRLTIRHAQCHPWIKLKEDCDPDVHSPVKYLKSMRFSKIVEGLDEDNYSD